MLKEDKGEIERIMTSESEEERTSLIKIANERAREKEKERLMENKRRWFQMMDRCWVYDKPSSMMYSMMYRSSAPITCAGIITYEDQTGERAKRAVWKPGIGARRRALFAFGL